MVFVTGISQFMTAAVTIKTDQPPTNGDMIGIGGSCANRTYVPIRSVSVVPPRGASFRRWLWTM
jgi:hypothetical protein